MTRHIAIAARNILLLSSLASCSFACAQSKTVGVTDRNPVLKSIKMLEDLYHVPVSFEDSRYVNKSLLEDVTEQVQRTPDPSHRIMSLKERTLSFTYKLPPQPPSAEAGWPFITGGWRRTREERVAKLVDALKSVLDGYAAAGGPESFSVIEEDGRVRVMATNFLNEEGKLQPLPAILDTKITIPPGQRTRGALLNEICRVLSTTIGVRVEVWNPPIGIASESVQKRDLTTISGSGVTARSLLSQLLDEMDVQSPTKYETRETAWTIGGGASSIYALGFHHVALNDRQ